MNVAISQKNLHCKILDNKNERKWNERKYGELTVCAPEISQGLELQKRRS